MILMRTLQRYHDAMGTGLTLCDVIEKDAKGKGLDLCIFDCANFI